MGWFASEAEKAEGSANGFGAVVHVFSPMVTAVFLPTSLIELADPSLALAVRMMCNAHASRVRAQLVEESRAFDPRIGTTGRLRPSGACDSDPIMFIQHVAFGAARHRLRRATCRARAC